MDDAESQSLAALSDVLTSISANPYDLSLHAQHIKLAAASRMDDQVMAARQMLTGYWAAGDEVWLPLIEARMQQGIDSVQDTLELLELFQTAEQDYLSIPILRKHIEFLIDRHAYLHSLNPKPEDLGDAFSPEWTRMMLESVVQKGVAHPTMGHHLWNAYYSWEVEQLENNQLQGEDRSDQILRVEDMLLERLKQPHSTHDETFQLYSTFTTNFKPPNIYEKLLVQASKEKAYAVKAYTRREQYEQYLEQSEYSLEAYNYYLEYERRARKIDLPVISMLYERAISDAAKKRFQGADNAEIALRVFWLGYCDTLRSNDGDNDHRSSVFKRAIRSIPGSGAIWAGYIRFLERAGKNDTVTLLQFVSEIYDKAFSTGLLQREVEEIVPVVLARAGVIKRTIMETDEAQDLFGTVFHVLEEGIKMVREASRQGDPRYRLENFLAGIYISLAESPDLASAVWETTAKHYKSSYLAWTHYIDSLKKEEKYNEARAVFRDIVTKRLDWPEAIFDSWIEFEHLHGSLDEIYDCLDKVEHAQNQVNSRRVKEAQKASLQAQAELTSKEANKASQAPDGSESLMQVDDTSSDTKKRKSEAGEEEMGGGKKQKTALASTLKRDREHCTVFVAELPADASENDLAGVFKDCGSIREIKVSTVGNSRVATVEFHDKENVLGALTKDKKRINDQEISVHIAWQSTLYVTNFPEKTDDECIRQLFGQFGLIFDVRWPSKKFKASRRFCYVQFVSKTSAEAALSLHGKELEPGLAMNVFISDPERKKERTDANANDREVYVAGLSKFVTEGDLEKLFKTYGTVKEIRLLRNDAGQCKGVAFVEFEDETSAQRALQANNYDLKNRRMSVTLSDARVRARHKNEPTASGLAKRTDIQSRSVRIKGLPLGTQEALLQQALEKIVPVKRLEVFQDLQEATVELESAADAGKLLLLKDPVQFGGKTLKIVEEATGAAAKRTPQPKAGGSMFVPRNVPSRPRAGVGSAKKQVGSSSNTATNIGDKPRSESVKSQDDFRKMLS